MPSKGVDVYGYIAVPDCQIQFSVPKKDVICRDSGQFFREHLEVNSENIHGAFNFTGRFSFRVTHQNQELTHQWNDINAVTGHLEDGTMQALKNCVSVVNPNIVVTYGFYDAGQVGNAGLPDSDQCYVTVTPNYSSWMGQAAPHGSELETKPFSRFVLPAVHDVGMNTMQNAITLLQHAGDDVIKLALSSIGIDASLHLGVANSAIGHVAPNIVESLAITQKDSLPALLAIGARYFEFRPAHVFDKFRPNSPLGDELYFQHACIPGMNYRQFLEGIVTFLNDHPSEIVFVQIRMDGVLPGCAHPENKELDALADDVIRKHGGALVRGGVPALGLPICELRNQHKRLILVRGINSYSSYTDEANATFDGDSIVEEFKRLDTQKQNGVVFTNIQCQATATNIKDAVIYSALSANASNSCLLSTKAICDSKTLPWIRQHALDKLKKEQLVVIMNDFMDGATADVAVGLSKRRLAA